MPIIYLRFRCKFFGEFFHLSSRINQFTLFNKVSKGPNHWILPPRYSFNKNLIFSGQTFTFLQICKNFLAWIIWERLGLFSFVLQIISTCIEFLTISKGFTSFRCNVLGVLLLKLKCFPKLNNQFSFALHFIFSNLPRKRWRKAFPTQFELTESYTISSYKPEMSKQLNS